ncbi:MAG: hypothetical protein C4527_21320 [Candidatus Omnitrophota bacterium]|nr:MAG: hypothetical protein C4527_21320 [Candidatus Omnitrophota bacterium]
MKIDFTKEEFRNLLDMVFIASWVLENAESPQAPKTKKYRDLEQKLYAYVKKMGLEDEDLVEYVDEFKSYIPTSPYEEGSECRAYIDKYESEIFWDDLADILSERDMNNHENLLRLKTMTPREQIRVKLDIEEKYHMEFVENGLQNLYIVKIVPAMHPTSKRKH